MAKFPTMEEFAKKSAELALDEFEYEGKTIREWTELILSGNLVEVSHARWEKCGGDLHSSGYAIYCSVCNKNHFVHYKYSLGGLYGCKELFERPKYCPSCGAIMEEGNDL